MMKKAISLLVLGRIQVATSQANVKFGECICCSVYACLAFCLFVPLFLVTLALCIATFHISSLILPLLNLCNESFVLTSDVYFFVDSCKIQPQRMNKDFVKDHVVAFLMLCAYCLHISYLLISRKCSCNKHLIQP